MHAGNENVNVRASMATGWHLDADRLYTVVLYVGAISILLGHPERRNLPRIRPEWYINCGCFDGTADLRQDKNVRSQSERGLLCISVMTFARAVAVIM